MTAASGYFITLALLVYGGAGVIGSLLGGMGADRTLRGTLAVVLAAATSALALLCVSSSAVALFCLLVWGAAFGALPLCLQLWIMRLAGDELEGGAALFVTCVQSSIAIGSALGGQLVNHYGAAADMAPARRCSWRRWRSPGAPWPRPPCAAASRRRGLIRPARRLFLPPGQAPAHQVIRAGAGLHPQILVGHRRAAASTNPSRTRPPVCALTIRSSAPGPASTLRSW